jgi:hypothetical protein
MCPFVDYLHVGGEVGKSFVEVIHLGQNADGCQDHENIGRGMAELVVASKGELERNTKSFDRHDRNGSNSRADGKVNESVLLAISGGNSVNHKDGETNDGEGVEKKA